MNSISSGPEQVHGHESAALHLPFAAILSSSELYSFCYSSLDRISLWPRGLGEHRKLGRSGEPAWSAALIPCGSLQKHPADHPACHALRRPISGSRQKWTSSSRRGSAVSDSDKSPFLCREVKTGSIDPKICQGAPAALLESFSFYTFKLRGRDVK